MKTEKQILEEEVERTQRDINYHKEKLELYTTIEKHLKKTLKGMK